MSWWHRFLRKHGWERCQDCGVRGVDEPNLWRHKGQVCPRHTWED